MAADQTKTPPPPVDPAVASSSDLFKPVKVGALELEHRVVMAPLTRMRNEQPKGIPKDIAVEYYAQRASKGGLLISEATFIAEEAGGYPGAPGIWSDKHIAAWKKVTDAVHAKGGKILCQLWALGYSSPPTWDRVSASDWVYDEAEGGTKPRPLTEDDIKRYVGHYAQAAKNALEAGFDGVEIHGANGYLIDQFFQTTSNRRTDRYGGSLENRMRFALEVIAAVVEAVGAERVGMRFSPFSTFQGMAGTGEGFVPYLETVVKAHPSLAYVHFVEPRFNGNMEVETSDPSHSLEPFREIVKKAGGSIKFFSAGGYTPTSAVERSNKTGDAIVFGRFFISTPDLPERILKGVPFTAYNRSFFYADTAEGYTTYLPYSQQLKN